uniref:C-type lectin domain-containing protein n=1 Tax=Ficedula albicollis TaxID=59894 RepID=A0A803W356_FICAL
MFAVLLPVWLLPGDFGLVSAAEPVGDPWCSGDNSQQEHTGISVAAIASLTSLLSWHPLVSVNMDFPHLFFPAAGCPPPWKKHGRKCYFFSPERKKEDWNSSRAECAAMGSDLVIIESRDELVRPNCWGSCSGGWTESLPSWLGFHRDLAHRARRVNRHFFVRAIVWHNLKRLWDPHQKGKVLPGVEANGPATALPTVLPWRDVP